MWQNSFPNSCARLELPLRRFPELRNRQRTAVASFTLAVDRDFSGKDGGEKECDFIDCVAWRHSGEFVSKYFTKGRVAVVKGRLQIRPWTDKDGNRRRSAEVVAESVYFGDSKKDDDSSSGSYGGSSYNVPGGYNAPGYGATRNPPGYVQSNNNFALLEDDDAQLPF